MPFLPSFPSRHRIRVVLSSPALQPFISVQKAAALAIAQLGVSAFFIAGVAGSVLGGAVAWFVLAAAVLGVLARAIDIESWALLVPGGVPRRAQQAFGPAAGQAAAAASLVERILLGALACVVVAHYAAAALVVAVAGRRFTPTMRSEDLATLLAVIFVGVLWLRIRVGRDIQRDVLATGISIGVGILLVAVGWGVVTAIIRDAHAVTSLGSRPPPIVATGWSLIDGVLTYLVGFALVLPIVGGGQALVRTANELPVPRVPALRRTALLTVAFAFFVIAAGVFLVLFLVPVAEHSLWIDAPLVGLAEHLAGPSWVRGLMAVALACAAALVLVPATYAALNDAEQFLYQSSIAGTLPPGLASLHTRFGTPTRVIDVTVAAAIVVILASGGRVAWLARGYGVTVATLLVLTVAVLVRLRRTHSGPIPYRTPANLRLWGHEVPLGLLTAGLISAGSVIAMLVTGDGASLTTMALLGTCALWFVSVGRTETTAVRDERELFDMLPSPELSPDHVDARPGNVLVPVRNPHALAHVATALRSAGDRDVVVMTVRLIGVDVGDEAAEGAPTRYEQQLLSEVVAVAEQLHRPVRLLIVPARNVVDAIVGSVIRLRSSEVHVGESSTLSTADQARLLGDAWERAEKPEPLDVRLVIGHRSGRIDTYHLGAHPPSLAPRDLELIHRVWLDAMKAVGPHVHHHDIVRAALTQMEQQLNGPNRDEALQAIREIARPAEELTELLRVHDYARLRDTLRNRHAGDVAELLTALSLEDQVLVFRVLPRKDAAAVFGYLSQEAKETLLKGMAQDDVAALLNNMAPDDRTLFLEELPAEATRQLLALLTPGERAVALTLLGYPEKSVGRLMTPHYVATREEWTVRQVLDYVREHGRDSETLNVIYVVDDQGLLIDDIRIREFLLAPLDNRVADLMDRRFVALKATDNQETAVGVFRQYDRTALPVTDTTGVLIGIVTIDDVLDVAEATATREIQRIGGSEALDEPYIEIDFWRMIQKRAGWLTALFLGEMLTATAMGFFASEIEKAVTLALFVPLIISSGGNSGSQAATLVIRALALGEVGLKDWWRVMRREILAGLALGAILASIGFLRITLWSAFSDMYGEHWFLIAVTVSISLVGVVLWGTLTGSLLPFLMRRLGFDPATSSAPFVATLVDVTGLVIYFSVAYVVLRDTLLKGS